MKAAVIGLGVEGKKATKSLLANGLEVYASDLNKNIDLEGLDIPMSRADIKKNNDYFTIHYDNLTIDIAYLNEDKLNSCDAILLSPGINNTQLIENIIKSGKCISNILTKHKNIFTIGITGTNGKTTTVLMLKEILEKSGKKVLVGGNAGGGFDGYCDIILKAEKEDFDIILIEVCDMTLKFCNYFFDFDLVALTNIGNDHMDVHGSIENYKNSLLKFSKDKTLFIDKNLEFKEEFKSLNESYINQGNRSNLSENNNIQHILEYSMYHNDLKVFGKFNRYNAGLASSIARYMGVEEEIIKVSLENFEAIEGRLKIYNLNDCKIFIGKTDNIHAIKSILDEQYFYATFIGTPRFNEEHRFDILNCLASTNPEVIVLFPGLDDTVDHALYRLKSIGYEGRIEIANNLDEIIGLIAEYSHEEAIFIGGNGQDTIIEIQNRLDVLSNKCK